MKISEVQITPIKPQNGLVAFASFVIDDSIYCSSVGIMTRPNDSYRLLYPTRKIAGRDISVYYPINKQVGFVIQEAVITKYEDVMKAKYDRYGSFIT